MIGLISSEMDFASRRLEGLVDRVTKAGQSALPKVPGLTLSRITTPVPPSSHFYSPSMCVCVRGERAITLGDMNFKHDSGRFLLSAIELPTIVAIAEASADRPFLGLQIDINLEEARQVIAEVDLHGIEGQHSGVCMTFGKMTEELLDAVTRLVRLLDTPGDIPVVAPLIQHEILYRLAVGPNGDRLRQIVRRGSPSHRVSKAIEWLRENYTKRMRVEQLADHVGMGVSTLHKHFHELTMVSPLQYQKHLRLHEARRLMLAENLDAASAAIQVGYESVTQFNREYRRVFGEPPRRDVRALRLLAEH